jgi:hypothetical protein
MGGTITFESKEGMGSTFSLTIPLGEGGPESFVLSGAESIVPETISPVLEGERIRISFLPKTIQTFGKSSN